MAKRKVLSKEEIIDAFEKVAERTKPRVLEESEKEKKNDPPRFRRLGPCGGCDVRMDR